MDQDFYQKVQKRIEKQALIDDSCFIAKSADIMGEVEIGPESSVWFQCVLRGDVNNIKIGARTNIQDGTIIHVSSVLQGTYIGDNVTIGHQVLLHACTIQDRAFIGMQACVMDGAVVESGAMVAAGALVPPGKVVKSGELWAGRPAKLMRPLTEEDQERIDHAAEHYVQLAKLYR